MKYYEFRTRRTSYFFPPEAEEHTFLYGLYTPFGGKTVRKLWDLFRSKSFVRRLMQRDESRLPFPYQEVKKAVGGDAVLAFNMGTPGPEQKISILGIDKGSGKPFFAKFSQKTGAKALTLNEIIVSKQLAGTGLMPELLDSRTTDDYVFMKTDYVEGTAPRIYALTEQMVDIALSISQHEHGEQDGLQVGLSHGDFCPWNMLEKDGELRLIDWEMAAVRPLGYDLFKFIYSCHEFFPDGRSMARVINDSAHCIGRYFEVFGVKNWSIYLRAFNKIRKQA